MHHNGVCVSANDARDFVACSHRHVPPAFGPGAHAARRPNICVFMQSIESSPRHRAETVRDQIDRSLENRKFRTVFEKVVGHWVSPLNWLLIYHGNVRTGSGSDRIVAFVEATGIRDIPSGPLLRVGHERFLPGLKKLVDVVRQASDGQTKLFIQLIDFLAVKRRPDKAKYFQRFLKITKRHGETLAEITED